MIINIIIISYCLAIRSEPSYPPPCVRGRGLNRVYIIIPCTIAIKLHRYESESKRHRGCSLFSDEKKCAIDFRCDRWTRVFRAIVRQARSNITQGRTIKYNLDYSSVSGSDPLWIINKMVKRRTNFFKHMYLHIIIFSIIIKYTVRFFFKKFTIYTNTHTFVYFTAIYYLCIYDYKIQNPVNFFFFFLLDLTCFFS